MSGTSDDLIFFTIEEVAQILKRHRSSITRLLQSGKLPYLQVGQGKKAKKIVRKSDLLEFIDKTIGVGEVPGYVTGGR